MGKNYEGYVKSVVTQGVMTLKVVVMGVEVKSSNSLLSLFIA